MTVILANVLSQALKMNSTMAAVVNDKNMSVISLVGKNISSEDICFE